MTNETIFIIKLISLILSKREFIILIYIIVKNTACQPKRLTLIILFVNIHIVLKEERKWQLN